VSGLKASLSEAGLSLRIQCTRWCWAFIQDLPTAYPRKMLHPHSLFSYMAIQRAHGHDRHSFIHLSGRGVRLCGLSIGRLEWAEDLDTAENTLEIFVTSNRGNDLKLLLQRPHVGAATRLPEIDCQAITLYTTPSPWRWFSLLSFVSRYAGAKPKKTSGTRTRTGCFQLPATTTLGEL
jgi:hypothetical protein